MNHTDATATRRTVLAATAGAAVAAGAPRTAAQEDPVAEHLSDVDNYDGVVDRTGEDEVVVEVGAGENGLRFGPAAVRVAAGTTVVWEWTGEGGAHNVATVEGSDGEFRSGDAVDSDSETFEQTFESPGTHLYVCEPHAMAGMRGAVVVAPPDPTPVVEEHLSDVDSYDGIEDHRGESEVAVEVGAGENGLRFAPPAIRVDPGTTVVWEWTGEGGAHNVASVEGSDAEFRSGDAVDSDSETFEQAFEEPGKYLYVCDPHAAAGMRGAVVVGDAGAGDAAGGGTGGGSEDLTTLAGVVALLLAPFGLVLAMLARELSNGGRRDRPRPRT